MSTFKKLHRTLRASTRPSSSADELPPPTLRGPPPSPAHRGARPLRILSFRPRHAHVPPPSLSWPTHLFLGLLHALLQLLRYHLTSERTGLGHSHTRQRTDVGQLCKWYRCSPPPPRPGFWILSLLPSICLHKAHILSTDPQKGSRLLHGVMTLHSKRRGGERRIHGVKKVLSISTWVCHTAEPNRCSHIALKRKRHSFNWALQYGGQKHCLPLGSEKPRFNSKFSPTEMDPWAKNACSPSLDLLIHKVAMWVPTPSACHAVKRFMHVNSRHRAWCMNKFGHWRLLFSITLRKSFSWCF